MIILHPINSYIKENGIVECARCYMIYNIEHLYQYINNAMNGEEEEDKE